MRNEKQREARRLQKKNAKARKNKNKKLVGIEDVGVYGGMSVKSFYRKLV
jgi:hypothetical protein